MKTTILLFASILVSGFVFGQKDWSNVDFADEYKLKVKIGGKSAKMLKNNKTFVNEYTISQATTMKGNERSATKGVFSEVALSGIDNEAYQKMVDELYKDLVKELESAGLQVSNGEKVLSSDYAQKRLEKEKNNEFVGNTGDNPAFEGKMKITDGAILGYGAWAVTRDVSFPPSNKNRLVSNNRVTAGLFYQNASKDSEANLLGLHFYVAFANFDGGRGYKDIKLETEPVLSVNAAVQLITPNGAFNKVFFKKLPAWGSKEWSEGIEKGKDNKHMAEFLGLARSAEFEITANSEKYLSEVRSLIGKLQKDIVDAIEAEL
jgi:hypothetical protein